MNSLGPIELTSFKVAEASRRLSGQLEQARPVKRIGAAALALMMSGSLALTNPRSIPESDPAAIIQSSGTIKTNDQKELSPPNLPAEEINIAPTATVTAEPGPPHEALSILQTLLSISSEALPPGLDPISEAVISAAKPTAEGYKAFINNIDQSFFDFAQGYREFNPAQNGIEQGQTQFFTWHFTGTYSNANELSTVPAGDEMNVKALIDMMANREGNKCCAVNWLIGRDGHIYQVTPANAKLRHNPPFDAVTTGVEIEANGRESAKPVQYESAIYLTVAVLRYQGLLGGQPLPEVAKGHAETRDRWNAENPNNKWDGKIDFDAAVSARLRQKMAEFLQSYPEALITPSNLR